MNSINFLLVLEDVKEGKKLEERQYKTLDHTKDLLSKIIKGAELCTNMKTGAVIEDLTVYEYALSAIEKCTFSGNIKNFPKFFNDLHDNIRKIKYKDGMKKHLKVVEEFFNAFSNVTHDKLSFYEHHSDDDD